jgi:flavin reductase (DIM6/NTAB) family NADH-FMN oxidoreductase RutF
MTMGWHTVMEFMPSLVGCIISSSNHSFEMIRQSRECVINVPTVDLAEAVVRIGNSSGRDLDKFAAFGLTAVPGTRVKAPLIRECFASFECKPVVKAHVATTPRYPRTLHYRGDGVFMFSGPNTRRYRRLFRPEML